MSEQEQPQLKRVLGVKSLALNAINQTVGGGIFALPATVAIVLGPSSFLAYLACGFLIVLIMLCFADVGSKITDTGGAYAYVENAFGPYIGFVMNTLFWFGYTMLSIAAIINVMADALSVWLPALENWAPRFLFFVAVLGTIAWVNIRGAKSGARFSIAMTLIKLVPIFFLIVLGIFNLNSQNLKIEAWPGISDLGETSLTLFFAFVGVESILSNSGEIKNPKRSVPLGVMLGVAGILVIYLLIQFVTYGILGSDIINHTEAPLASAAQVIAGSFGASLLLAGSFISIFGTISVDMLASPRIIHAAAKDKLLPNFLAYIHPKFSTPRNAILLYAFCTLVFASSGGFRELATLASASTLIIYLSVVLATIKLKSSTEFKAKEGYTLPGGYTIPVLALVTVGWFLSHMPLKEVYALLIFVAITSAIYFIYKKFRK